MVGALSGHGNSRFVYKLCIDIAIHSLSGSIGEIETESSRHEGGNVGASSPLSELIPARSVPTSDERPYRLRSEAEIEIKKLGGVPDFAPVWQTGQAMRCGIDISHGGTGCSTASDVGHLNVVLEHEIAENTLTNYGVQWRSFLGWAQDKGVHALPAEPEVVAAYLSERIQEHRHKPATLRSAACAIAFVHKSAGAGDPCASQEVKRMLKAATRKEGRCQKQAAALTAEGMEAIRSTAHNPRLGRGGRLERAETARSRGNVDIALIGLMRDAMLRVSEAAAVTWGDIETENDGTGRLLVRRSKTDANGEGAVLFVSAQTMANLAALRTGKAESDSVFGLRPNQISGRIKKAAQEAGLGHGFSGHSPRVGMARDLARAGTELTSLMNAGRWRSPAMPAHYIRNEVAGKGAVARFHGYSGTAS